jgi:hypothetical protein
VGTWNHFPKQITFTSSGFLAPPFKVSEVKSWTESSPKDVIARSDMMRLLDIIIIITIIIMNYEYDCDYE